MHKTSFTEYPKIIKALPILATIVCGLLFLWFAIYLGLAFEAYVWVFSDDLMVEAFQQLVRVLWLMVIILSPIWIIFLCIGVFMFVDGHVYEKYMNHKEITLKNTPNNLDR